MSEAALVTGGAGFIGSALVRGLVSAGRRVVVYDDLSVGRAEHLGGLGVRLERGDVRDGERLARLVRELRPRSVFHLAAIHFIPRCNAEPVRTVEVNVDGTRQVLAACRAALPELVFFASTAAVYPAQGSPFAESHPVGPIDVYGHTKLIGEELVALYQRETGAPAAIGRFFNAFGPNETNPHVIPDILAQLDRPGGLRLGNLDPVRDYVHADDVVAAALAIEAGARGGLGVFNIGSGRGHTVRGLVAAVEQALGRRLRVEQDPARVRRVERMELVADVSKLRRETGWAPRVELAQGLEGLIPAGLARGADRGAAPERGEDGRWG